MADCEISKLCKLLDSEIDKWTSSDADEEVRKLSDPTTLSDARFGYDDEYTSLWGDESGFKASPKGGGPIFTHNSEGRLVKIEDRGKITTNHFSRKSGKLMMQYERVNGEGCRRRFEWQNGKPETVIVQFLKFDPKGRVTKRVGAPLPIQMSNGQ